MKSDLNEEFVLVFNKNLKKKEKNKIEIKINYNSFLLFILDRQ